MGILDVLPTGQLTGPLGQPAQQPQSPFLGQVTRSLPILGNLIGPSQTFQPVQVKAAANQQALINKVTELKDFYNGLQPHVRDALVQFDADRVAQGSAPLTREQTIAAGNAAQARQLPTEGTGRDWWNIPGNLLHDARSVISSIPRLVDPRTWIHEASQLPHISESIQAARDAGADPLQAIAQAPGIRMLPGSFVAGNIMHPTELAKHPLFTALDTLPAAEAFAKSRPVVQEAARVAELAGEPARSPLRTFATKTLDETGAIVPNALGQFNQRMAQETAFGRILSETFGHPTRDVMGNIAMQENRIIGVREGLIPASNPVEQLTRESEQLAQKYGQTQEQRIALTEKMKAGDTSAYTPTELAIVREYRDISNRFAQDIANTSGELAQLDNEWFPRQQAAAITQARTTAEAAQRISILRDEYLSPSGQLTPEDFTHSATQAATNPVKRVARHELEATMRAADAYGFDMTAARKLLTHRNKASLDQTAAAISDAVSQPAATRIPMQDILQQLQQQPNHTQATALAYAIADGNPTRITAALDNLLSQRNSRLHWLDDPGVIETLKSYRDRIAWENRYGKLYTSQRAARATTKAERLADRTVPARFGPAVTSATRQRALDAVLPRATTAGDVEAITRAMTEARWTDVDDLIGTEVGTTKQLYSGIEKETAATWRTLRDEGIDPEFIHRVSRSQANQVSRPRIGPVPNTISQVKERALDMSPAVDDWAVALTHQGVERLTRMASESVIDHVVQRYGVRQSDLQAQFAPWARDMETPLNFQQQLRDQIGDQYEHFNPDERGYSWGGANLDKYRQESWFIPKSLANNLHRVAEPKGLLGGVFDPLTKTFRMSVVGLSPRTQLYNILGGAMMLFGETGPGAFKYWRQARQMVKNPGLIEDEVVRTMLGSQKREFLDSDLARAKAQTGVLMGKTARRIYDQAQQSGVLSKAKSGVNKLIEKSFDLNGLFDDQYRVMAYLYGHDRALTKGMSAATASRAGEELLRRTMMDWTTLTPIERNVFKTIFPFYGFMRHAIQYVTRYPVDHPLRASVLGAFGKSETDDLNGLPLSFLSMVPWGGEGAGGHQNYLSLGGVNPFASVPDMFTIAGYLSATNPLISTALESVGISSRGEAELYPTLTFDPETGRLGATHNNPLETLAANVIPQTQLLTSLLGVNKDFNDRLTRDPAGAMRSLLANGGLPVIWRDMNVPQEYFKAEVNRLKSVNDQLNQARTTGDWSAASSMPTLQTALDDLRQQTPQQLAGITPPVQQALQDQVNALLGTPGNQQSVFTH